MRVPVSIDSSYPVVVGSLDSLASSADEAGLPVDSAIIVSDENVWSFHGDRFADIVRKRWGRVEEMVLPAGEMSKSTVHLSALWDRALSWGIDRQTVVLAFGGGVIGDLAGFAGATLLRGLPVVHVPTSMIAQVDSSIGGKTGINHERGKNLIGSFHTPALVHADPRLLSTLPDREYHSGLAEAVKHGLIADRGLVEWLDASFDGILARKEAVVEKMISRAMRVKVDIVSKDLFERGRRSLLNFGHTFGHAIERVAGYGAFTHGEAVAVGMLAATRLSSILHPDQDFGRAYALVKRIPVEASPNMLDTEALLDAMQYDKKVEGGSVRFVVLKGVGRAYLRRDVAAGAVRDAIEYAKSE